MSAYGTFSPYCATPKGLANTVGAAHTRVRHVAGCREKPPAPLPQSVGSPPTCKGQAATRFFASLDRFPAPSASVSFATPTEMERGQGRRSRAFLPLTPWNRPNTHRRGRWIGLPPAPAASQVSGVWGKAPGLFLFLKLLGWM